MSDVIVLEGDSLVVLKDLPENSIDSVICDPPYGLSFMGKKWDYDVPSTELWREVLRVLKPGGHLLSFGGTRTYHRMVVAIEDAGFEIRDQIMWIYGSGFPKSMDVSKAIDKAAGAEREVVGFDPIAAAKANKRPAGEMNARYRNSEAANDNGATITAPATDDAKLWQGWGTALKPANEPIVLARKPLSESTVAKNVLKWGTGCLNIDASRIGMQPAQTYTAPDITGDAFNSDVSSRERKVISVPAQGRWPANVLFDEEAAAVLDKSTGLKDDVSRFFYCAKTSKAERNRGLEGMPKRIASTFDGNVDHEHGNRKIGASPDKPTQLQQNHHPTVKPIKLMEYLIRLVTPPGGVVLDPFMGSGSTGVAAKNLGFSAIGIEREPEYVKIAQKRTGS